MNEGDEGERAQPEGARWPETARSRVREPACGVVVPQDTSKNDRGNNTGHEPLVVMRCLPHHQSALET